MLRLALEGDRWRYTGIVAGTAEIRVTQDDTRRLTHAVDVRAAPAASYDYEITNVTRYQSIFDAADWLEFRWIAHVTASRFRVRVTFPQGAFRTTCTETWYGPEAGEQNDEIDTACVRRGRTVVRAAVSARLRASRVVRSTAAAVGLTAPAAANFRRRTDRY